MVSNNKAARDTETLEWVARILIPIVGVAVTAFTAWIQRRLDLAGADAPAPSATPAPQP